MKTDDKTQTTQEQELERLIQEMHRSYNPGAGAFDIEAALGAIREGGTTPEHPTQSQTTDDIRNKAGYDENEEDNSLGARWCRWVSVLSENEILLLAEHITSE